MPTADPADEIYARGKYRLIWDRKNSGELRSPFPQIVWYDKQTRRTKSLSTGTTNVSHAEIELDRLYLQIERGQAFCPTCGRETKGLDGTDDTQYFLADAIADYLVAKEETPSFVSIRARLSHILNYQQDSAQTAIICETVDEKWIQSFRNWAINVPIITPGGVHKVRTIGTVEGSVRQLAAAINYAFGRKAISQGANFKPRKPKDVSVTPTFRADVPLLARMMRYATVTGEFATMIDGKVATPAMVKRHRQFRDNLLRFLQISIATWARPDAAHDVSTNPNRMQWIPTANAINLNQKGRHQTRKYRPVVPVGPRVAKLLNANTDFFVKATSVGTAFVSMSDELKLPRDGETGLKLIRRSMSTIARKRLGETHWVQGRRMLGHIQGSMSDVYAMQEPEQLGRVLKITNGIIEEICRLAPGAFDPKPAICTGDAPEHEN